MKRQIKIAASFTGVISTGSYENSKPMFFAEETFESDLTDNNADTVVSMRQKQLQDICRGQFEKIAGQLYAEKIAKQYANIRFYDADGGIKYPSVTSIVGMDKDFHMPPDELAQYAARGTILHKQAEIYMLTNEWKDARDIAEVSHEYMTVMQGNLKLSLDDTNFKGFLKDYPIEVIQLEQAVLNNEDKYGGRYDILCKLDPKNLGKWDKVEGIDVTKNILLDIKTSATLDKNYGFTQNAAYAKCLGVDQIGLIHLNKEVKAGFSKPAVTSNVARYWDLFIKKRQQFYGRYGI